MYHIEPCVFFENNNETLGKNVRGGKNYIVILITEMTAYSILLKNFFDDFQNGKQ